MPLSRGLRPDMQGVMAGMLGGLGNVVGKAGGGHVDPHVADATIGTTTCPGA
jgi:hypothetical protein